MRITRAAAAVAMALGLAVAIGPVASPRSAGAQPQRGLMASMRSAAHAFGVPVRLLLAISYVETRWQRSGAAPSIDGGYGVMNLTAPSSAEPDGRGGSASTARAANARATLEEAARLLHLPAATLERSERQNIRGAAAVLARYERRLEGGALPRSLDRWYGAVARYSGVATVQSASLFADEVFATLAHGAALTLRDGESIDLRPTPDLRPDRSELGRLGLVAPAPGASSTRVDCPHSLKCRFVPAAYAKDGKNPSNYGNYATAGRPNKMLTPTGQTASMDIRYIVIHDTEGSYADAISIFQNPASYVSANYVVRSSDGMVTEMVRPRDVSWGAANWYVNMHAINIENEGFAAQGATWYTQAEYRSDAALVRYLSRKYDIPLDRQHIIGHEDVPGETTAGTAAQHWDPGPFWNWNHFMALVHRISDKAEQARGGSTTRGDHQLVTIDPTFSLNKPTITDCASGCVTLPKQPANFVYLRTGPGNSHPLISDPILGPGTTVDSDWGDKATIGETFVFAGQHGNWTAIWFDGQKAWFHDPTGTRQTARFLGGEVITPKPGRKRIPVYGVAYPEASAYPSAVPVLKASKQAYTIAAGQSYPMVQPVPTDYYYAPTINSSKPDDHTVIIGSRVYYQISFNHRRFFVRASDVTVRTLH